MIEDNVTEIAKFMREIFSLIEQNKFDELTAMFK